MAHQSNKVTAHVTSFSPEPATVVITEDEKKEEEEALLGEPAGEQSY